MLRLDLKLEILKAGRPRYKIAQQLGNSESQLPRFVGGYGKPRSEKIEMRSQILGLEEESIGEPVRSLARPSVRFAWRGDTLPRQAPQRRCESSQSGERYTGCIGPGSRTVAKEILAKKKAEAVEGRYELPSKNPGALSEAAAADYLRYDRAKPSTQVCRAP